MRAGAAKGGLYGNDLKPCIRAEHATGEPARRRQHNYRHVPAGRLPPVMPSGP